jgi:hypothetical protein
VKVLARLGVRGTRIGEFTPLGFLIGFIFCFSFFWIVYHRLPFGTVPEKPAVYTVSAGEFEALSGRVKSDEQLISGLDKKVQSLELKLELEKKQKEKEKVKRTGPKRP